MPAVRQHTRVKPGGGTTTVRRHVRGRGLLSPRHSWGLLVRGFRASRKRKRVAAFAFAGLGVAELVAWLSLTGAGLVLATAAVLAGVFAVGAALVTGTGPADPVGRWRQ